MGLVHPRDRNGSLVTDRFSTPALETSLEGYRGACVRASERVRERLRDLAGRLLVADMTSVDRQECPGVLAGAHAGGACHALAVLRRPK